MNSKYTSFYYETLKNQSPLTVDAGKCVLLIVDMQNEFVDRNYGEALIFKENGEWERWLPFHDRLDDIVIPNTQKLLDFCRKHDILVTYARIACMLENGHDRSPVQKSEGWNGMFIHKNSFGAQIITPLAPQKNEIVIDKTTDSVTTGTNYLQLLRYIGINTVIVTGIVTDQCVASSVRGLADDGLQVICVEDACAAGDHQLHDMELKIINNIYCRVLSTEETLQLLVRV